MEQSSFGRLLSVLLSPSKTFEAIRERPTWVVALVIFILIGSLGTYLVVDRLDKDAQRDAFIEQQTEAGIRGADLEDNLERFEGFVGIQKWVFLGFTILFTPIIFLVFAGYYLGMARFVGGSEMSFRQSLSMTLHGSAPTLVQGLASLPVILSVDRIHPEEFESGSVGLITNLGFLAPEGADLLRVLLTRVDLFAIWSVVLTAIGLMVVGRVSKGMASGIAIGAWLLITLLSLGGALLGGAFGG